MATNAPFLFLLAVLLLWLLSRWWLQRYHGLRKWRRPDHRTLFSDGPEASAMVRRDVQATRVLFVTAHPDDEAMFFAPTILALKPASLWLLCGSTGNYYQQGEIRKAELIESCEVLGIPPSNVTVLDHRKLPDHPSAEWDVPLLTELILSHIETHHIDLVVTFDARGVSGHPNHRSVYAAVRSLHSQRKVPEDCRFLVLETVNVFRKYISIWDAPLSGYQNPDVLVTATEREAELAQRAMRCHHSQLLWFRRLYVRFSRYMVINSLRFL
ncbi:N-acetylglucosaminyl-phosphatidylinositol de-N-acetylase [Thamnophis elegans]|uniref:N-acetylglucosaminyl-phosphatidylinositol de-N-acetylase n=1 Tax=Thamnophis elegans TaxID=35005 RepID=UPI00137692E2|nr:N-acetylglucosaminyl-phosphatidylinositol de-N-acetylase [Thamnophis elegans]